MRFLFLSLVLSTLSPFTTSFQIPSYKPATPTHRITSAARQKSRNTKKFVTQTRQTIDGGSPSSLPTSTPQASMSKIHKTKTKSAFSVSTESSEALSHSETTMKLLPSYELFQILPVAEGGVVSKSTLQHTNTDTTQHNDDYILDTNKIPTHLPDPFALVEKEIKPFSDSISSLVSNDQQPVLSMAAKHFFEKRQGKKFRPTIVSLVSKAVAACETSCDLNMETSDWECLGASDVRKTMEGGLVNEQNHKGSDVWRRQGQLGQIVEMIHVASLIHDDVLGEAFAIVAPLTANRTKKI